MTPEEFRARATAAVSPLDPAPVSYTWLSANVARRGRRSRLVWVAAAATAATVAGVALAVVPGGSERPPVLGTTPSPTVTPTAPRSPAPSATTTPTAPVTEPSPTVPVAAPRDPRDLDGDGRADTAEIVESTSDRSSRTWRYGVRARMTRLGTQTVWQPYGESSNEAQRIAGFYDVDGDGDGELAVVPGGTAFGDYYELYTVVGENLRRVEGLTLAREDRPDEISGWTCDSGRVVSAIAILSDDRRTYMGTRIFYRLDGARLVRTNSRGDSWRAGTTPPEPYTTAGC